MNQPTLAPADPRPAFTTATARMTDLLSAVTADTLDRPTPCTEFDVATLTAHILGVAQRSRAIATGGDVLAIDPIAAVRDADSFAATIADTLSALGDDAVLGRPVTVPWGTVPVAGALWGYVNEMLVHGWDLAVATGQPAESDDTADAAATALSVVRPFISADIRDDPAVPFGPVVAPRPAAGPTERLANWSGRSADGWV
ncbi:MAG: TIGR03086 family metal-binding protein [Gordonia sp. (in: high G+C Gram-positive bacteria)]